MYCALKTSSTVLSSRSHVSSLPIYRSRTPLRILVVAASGLERTSQTPLSGLNTDLTCIARRSIHVSLVAKSDQPFFMPHYTHCPHYCLRYSCCRRYCFALGESRTPPELGPPLPPLYTLPASALVCRRRVLESAAVSATQRRCNCAHAGLRL